MKKVAYLLLVLFSSRIYAFEYDTAEFDEIREKILASNFVRSEFLKKSVRENFFLQFDKLWDALEKFELKTKADRDEMEVIKLRFRMIGERTYIGHIKDVINNDFSDDACLEALRQNDSFYETTSETKTKAKSIIKKICKK